MHLFYTPDIYADQSHYDLSEEESKHCNRVLRLVQGDGISMVDGRGNWFDATIVDVRAKRVRVEIRHVQAEKGRRDYYIHIAIAPTKRMERFEWFLEKATEIGVDAITPLITDNSERKDVKAERMNKIVVAAMKQSLKAYLPQINASVRLKDFLGGHFDGERFIAHCAPDAKQVLSTVIEKHRRYLILIGPEGDFSPQEIDKAKEAGYVPISLGDARLRTETAGIAACLEISFLNR